MPGGELQVAGDNGSGSGAQIFYSLSGPEDEIAPAAEKVAAVLRATPGSVNVQTSAENGAPRLNVDVDSAKCAVLGVNPSDVANVARIAVDGAVATNVRTANRPRRRARAVPAVGPHGRGSTAWTCAYARTMARWCRSRRSRRSLGRRRRPRSSVSTVSASSMCSATCCPATRSVQSPVRWRRSSSSPASCPQGVGSTAQGDTQFMQETFANMGIALLLSFMLVYMLMVILYGSFLEPLIVMFSVPMAIIGALIFLALMGTPRARTRAVAQHHLDARHHHALRTRRKERYPARRLFEHALQARHAREGRRAAVAATRFRPIIMTTAAMIFGMLPLALGFAEGGEWRQAMGTVIIGGLLSSLILTLFLVPMIYNTWMGFFERRGDRRAVAAELEGAPAAV